MGQSLFVKHSRFQNFDETFYCGMTTSEHKNHSKKKIRDRVCLRNIQNSENLVERPDLGTLNQVFLDNIKTQELFLKREIWDRIVLRNFQRAMLKNILITHVRRGHIQEQESLSNRYLEESLPQKNYRGIWKYSNSTVAGSKISFFMIFIQNGIKRIRINLLVKQEVDAATVLTTFS